MVPRITRVQYYRRWTHTIPSTPTPRRLYRSSPSFGARAEEGEGGMATSATLVCSPNLVLMQSAFAILPPPLASSSLAPSPTASSNAPAPRTSYPSP